MSLKLDSTVGGPPPMGGHDDPFAPDPAPVSPKPADGLSSAPTPNFFDAVVDKSRVANPLTAGFINIGTIIEDFLHPKVTTGLGADADKIVNQSLQLRDDIKALQDKGWSIQFGAAGGGSFSSRTSQTITVDPNRAGAPASLAQTVAHETGHARYPEPVDIPPNGLTHDQFVNRNVDQHLRDEGAANFENCVAREQILARGGPDIGVAGTQQAQYLAIYKDFEDGKITKDQAYDQMGQLFGNETTSNTGENYRTYYGKKYERDWQVYQISEGLNHILPWWKF
jgi:hypothetical protein